MAFFLNLFPLTRGDKREEAGREDFFNGLLVGAHVFEQLHHPADSSA